MKFYGADYYPEQETREEIIRDARRLREQGFNVVRIGEFAWSVLEPREQEYHIEWLLDVIDILGKEGVHSIVCSPSACPPIWLFEKHPEIAYIDNRGVRRPFGGRRHYCYNSDVYRSYCRTIVEKIAVAIKDNPYVIGFHVDNELAQEATGRCHCPSCEKKFRGWLEEKYGTIEEFNRRAGTVFWSQTYSDFGQIPLPTRTIEFEGVNHLEPFFDNPTIRLDFERFCSDSFISFTAQQTEIFRAYSSLPVTTNTTGITTCGVNYYDLFKDMDVVSVDEYPPLRHTNLKSCAASLAFSRGIKNGQNFWIVETSSGGGQGSWAREGVPQPYPGTLRQLALHSMASGTDLFTYFQYKTFRFGAEQLEASVMDIDGESRRRNREFLQTAKDIQEWTPLLESTVIKNQAAVCFDYDCHWAIRIKPFSKEYDYRKAVLDWHSLLNSEGVPADVIPLDESIFQYKLVVIPTALVLPDAFKEMLKAYVKQGGIVVATYLTGQKNVYNNADRVSVPAGLTDLFGMRVGEVDVVHSDIVAGMQLRCNGHVVNFTNKVWTESLELQGAEPVVVYTDTYRADEVAASCHHYGKGWAVYLGTELSQEALHCLVNDLAEKSGLSRLPIRCSSHSDVVVRWDDQGQPVFFLFNGEEAESTMDILQPLKTLSGDVIEAGTLTLPPKGFLICRL